MVGYWAYWAYKHQHVIGTFNTSSRGPIHWSLTDIGGGYNLRGATFSHTTPRSSQPVVSTFHLRAPSNLQFNQGLPKVPKFKFREPMTTTWSFDNSAIYRDLQLCLAIINKLSLAIGSARVDCKVSLMQLGHPFNSYNLMHKQES
jgi:hypothetical protein